MNYEAYKRKTVIEKFYPPSNKQESISIDPIEESRDAQDPKSSGTQKTSDILLLDGSEE